MDIDRDIPSFLATQKTTMPAELHVYLDQFEDLYDRKLWHQFTLTLHEFIKIPSSSPFLIPFYENVLIDFEKKLNPFFLTQYMVHAAKQLKDAPASLSFLNMFLAKLDVKKSVDAFILCIMESAHFKLLTGDVESCKKDIDECEKLLDSVSSSTSASGFETIVHASFYRVAADYYKAKAAYPKYYHNALLFLSSVNVDELTVEERVERAHDLVLSALLGEGLYNFGELLMHPILDALDKSSFAWLKSLLFTFNKGDIASFEKISISKEYHSIPLVVSSTAFISQKLRLMTLVESVFKRSKEERSRLSFEQVCQECKVAIDEVEHLLMKALSIGLIKGKIDEIDRVAQIHWVQPRVLDKSQIQSIIKRLEEWSAQVTQRVVCLEQEGTELIIR